MGVDQVILKALQVNMGYQPGERAAIVIQEWAGHLGEDNRLHYERSRQVAEKMHSVFKANDVDVEMVSYAPAEARHGVDATPEAYKNIGTPDIIFMPTAFSLTHTRFRVTQTDRGARVASMPTFTLEMFAEDGPMNVDYDALQKITEAVAEKLRSSNYVRITAEGTDIVVEVDRSLVEASSGILRKKGDYGNLPGAEAFAVPVHEGKSNGFLTVPAGWGGTFPLKYGAKFQIRAGRFVDIRGDTAEAQAYIDDKVKPLVFKERDFNVLAELGVGTNPNITPDYVAQYGWSILTGEKISGSAHFANGNSKAMGGRNDVPVHMDWVVPDVKIEYNF